jgi:shikimate kinase
VTPLPSIALVGMPGSGKSTVGRHLARQLGWRFVDSDAEIEREIGQPIRAFFEQHGEAAFRDIEQAAIARLAQERGIVLATGGGSVLRPANREALARGCVVIYLKSTPEDLFRRLRHDTQRPLLQVADPLRRLRDLYRERDPLYRAAARFIIETGRPTVPTLVNMILMQLELAGIVDPQRPPPTAHEAPRRAD